MLVCCTPGNSHRQQARAEKSEKSAYLLNINLRWAYPTLTTEQGGKLKKNWCNTLYLSSCLDQFLCRLTYMQDATVPNSIIMNIWCKLSSHDGFTSNIFLICLCRRCSHKLLLLFSTIHTGFWLVPSSLVLGSELLFAIGFCGICVLGLGSSTLGLWSGVVLLGTKRNWGQSLPKPVPKQQKPSQSKANSRSIIL